MVLLIDANVLLDVLMNRREFIGDSSAVWKICETGQAKGCVSALTLANLMYIMRRELTPEIIEQVFRKLNMIFEIADLNRNVLEKAASMKWKDFEEAVQSASAEQAHADYIITRNVRDFTESRVIACTPAEFLKKFYENRGLT